MGVSGSLTVERDGMRRTYNVWYAEDPPERAEAVQFFQAPHKLFPEMDLPPAVYQMALPEADAYLRDHPIPKRWSMLTLWGPVADDDLARLQYLPELEILKIHSDVSDCGISHIRHLHDLEWLVLYSGRVTDACLQTVSELESLRMLDMQGSHRVSPEAFSAAVGRMPKLERSWPPWSAA
jgi:hypothetical protein